MRAVRLSVFMVIMICIYSSIDIYRSGFHLNRDLFSALTNTQQKNEFKKAQSEYRDRMGREMVFMVQGQNPKQASEASQAFAAHLEKSQMFSQVKAHFDADEFRNLGKLYFPYRRQLIRPAEIEKIKSSSEQTYLNEKLSDFYSPWGMSSAGSLTADPFGFASRFLMQMAPRSQAEIIDGYLISDSKEDGAYAFLFATVGGDWTDLNRQTEIMQVVDSFNEAKVLKTGALPFMESGVVQAQNEISLIGTGSMIGIFIIFLVLFRTLLPLLVSVSLITLSLGIGVLVTHAVFGSVHLFTFVLSSSLIGVIDDYTLHFFAKGYTDEGITGREAIAHMDKALWGSALTTLSGFVVILFTPIPVLQQMSVFSLSGFITALGFIYFGYPYLKIKTLKDFGLGERLRVIPKYIVELSPRAYRGLLIGLLLFSAGLLFSVRFDEDVRKLQNLPAKLKSEEESIRSVLARDSSGTYALVRGGSFQELLQNEESLLQTLDKKYAAIGSGVSTWVPSEFMQKKSFETYQSILPWIQGFYEQVFKHKAGSKNFEGLNPGKFELLEFSQVEAKAASLPMLKQYLGKVDQYFFSAVQIQEGSNKIPPLIDSNAVVINEATDATQLLEKLRDSLFLILPFGFLLVIGALVWQRGTSSAFKLLIPPSFSVILALGITQLGFGHLNVFNVLAAILVFALSIDYSFFFFETGPELPSGTLIGSFGAGLTTIISFGLLALSQTHALSGFGFTIAVGITLGYLLAPIAAREG